VAVNLLELLRREFSSDAVAKIASAVGEPPAKTQSAIGALLPALLGGLASRASSSQGAGDLFKLLDQSGIDGSRYTNLGDALSASGGASELMRVGRSLASSIFGNREDTLVNAVSGSAGVAKSTISSLASLILPFVLNLIVGQLRNSGSWSPTGLASLLSAQTPFLSGVLPAGLSTALGLGEGATKVGTYATPPSPVPVVRERGSNWWKWLLPLLALALLLWALRSCRPEPTPPVTTTEPTTAPAPAPAPSTDVYRVADLGAFVTRKLPDSVEISIPERGVEVRLINVIEDRAVSRPRGTAGNIPLPATTPRRAGSAIGASTCA
jgi:OOP family OmpA-OmpF porin